MDCKDFRSTLRAAGVHFSPMRPSLQRSLPILRLLGILLAIPPASAVLPAQPAAPKNESIRLSSASSPELIAAVELNQAVRKGNLARTKEIIAATPSLLAEPKLRQALLVLAAQEAQPEIVQWLLQSGASPNEAHDKMLPLTAALLWTRDMLLQRQEKDPEVWPQLAQQSLPTGGTAPPGPASQAEKKASLEALRRFFVPMPPEVLARKAQVVDLLLAAGAKPVEPSASGTSTQSLVFLAAQLGFSGDVINRLVAAGADPRTAIAGINETPLHAAARSGNLGAAEALLGHHADLEALSTSPLLGQPGMKLAGGGITPLMAAIMLGQEDMVRFLLEQGAKPETTNRTLDRAVHFAATVGHAGILRELLARGTKVNVRDRWQSTPLHMAAHSGNLEAVKQLLAAQAELEAADEAGFTPLLSAVEYDHVETVRYLLAQGASRWAKTDIGKGPLRVAATSNALQVAEFLLEQGEKVDGVPSDSMRPLHEAASSGHPQMVALLLRHGASTEMRDRALQGTPLHLAIMSMPETARQWAPKPGLAKSSYALAQNRAADYLEIVRLLAAQGADLNAPDRLRCTPLHRAAEFGDRATVELLLTLGARRDLVNARDLTAYDIALLKGHREIAALLQPATTTQGL